ncbi:hypothetical protein [Bacillus sp. CDB3]|uniref:hypothetical protein n=1 Tax=Bacillus sp. CDB3 TaxID=360310 RepID=UPI002118D1F6|nr:hypothetical protein [Bacillus sp. CDB3]
MKKKPSNQSNSNFRQQESVMKDLDKNVGTTEKRNISQVKNAIEDKQRETDQGALQKESCKQLQHTNQKFQQQESTVQVVDRKFETDEQTLLSQAIRTLNSQQLETGHRTLQKQSSKLSQHINQKFQQQENTVQVVDRKFETDEQTLLSQAISTLNSQQLETEHGTLQKQSSKLSQHTNQKFQQQESTVQVVNRKFETDEQTQFSQTTSTIESPQQGTGQEKLQKQDSKVLQHIDQKLQQQGSTAKVLHKRFKTAEQKQILQTTTTIEGSEEVRQGTLQKQSSKLLQHTDQEMYQQHSMVKASSNKFKKIDYKNIRETKSVIEDLHEVGYGKSQKKTLNQLQRNDQKIYLQENTVKLSKKKMKTLESNNIPHAVSVNEHLQKLDFKRLPHINQEFRQQDRINDSKKQGILKTPQQGQLGQMDESPLKEGERNSKELLSTHPKIQKGLQFIGKLGRHSLIATKTEVTNSLITAQNTLKYGATTLGSSSKNGLKKYQQALEQDDQGVKVASQGATTGYRLVKKGFKKLRQRRKKDFT